MFSLFFSLTPWPLSNLERGGTDPPAGGEGDGVRLKKNNYIYAEE
jgi:hypothetical protein